jgi:protein-tyrosine phosphatase
MPSPETVGGRARVTEPEAEQFSILIVCTANRFRSPLAEFFLRAGVRTAGLPWRVGSAGTHARDGIELDPLTEGLLAEHGIRPEVWESRRLTPFVLADADLVLAADSSHRSAVAAIEPRARARTFLLRQFARLAGLAQPHELLSGANAGERLVSAVVAAQGKAQPAAAGADELADPAGRPMRALRACAAQIVAATDTITSAATAIENAI